ncbi:hypothetical protein BOTBODRAFT_51464 [Botryobasidium botryosum FD-172 SS1]|uniref:Glucose-methanol-choline oxidoreductase N-terminal domain-containing protein n=1 Tax=Botryobasidium botryosum (strain FD-172 SS1) TaxID=930990 RepID=A0A067MWX6_BOTB1|nr:hypothetical protein BOTBODRAFT_51464 [Botryobasidium botryosum FD-172 SS1]
MIVWPSLTLLTGLGIQTAGLALAARLSEDSAVTVCVLEAGHDNFDEPATMIPSQYGIHFGNPQFDWDFSTIPQPHSNNNVFRWQRGKGLGGTSAMNFSLYMRPPTFDIDAIERLGNPGWNWKRYLQYSKKAETFQQPTPEEVETHQCYINSDYMGKEGPLRIGLPFKVSQCDIITRKTFNNLGVKTQTDPISGVWQPLTSMDRQTGIRSYSVTAYYKVNQSRKNLTVLTRAPARKLILTTADDGFHTSHGVTATSVEFTYGDQVCTVHAHKEVILCAGALKSPQILELSGIGDPKVLQPLGIDVVVDHPGVGSNMQDHKMICSTFELANPGKWETFDGLSDPEYAREQRTLYSSSMQGIHRIGFGTIAFVPLRFVNSEVLDENIASLTAKVQSEMDQGLKEQWALQLEALGRDDIPDCEFITSLRFSPASGHQYEHGKKYMSVFGVLNHPISRGTVHVTSSNPSETPAIDSHYFEHEEDLRMIVEMLKFLRKLPETEPFKSMVETEFTSDLAYASDEDLRERVKDKVSTIWHTAGTCSMLPRERGGVVDPQLKVYGTTNIRVVDLSILPLHVNAHPQATVYSIAEQAADIIKGVI